MSLCWSHSHWAWEDLAGVSKHWGGLVVCRAWLQTAHRRGSPSLPAGSQVLGEISSGSGRRGRSCKFPLHLCVLADTNCPSHPSVLLNPEMLWAGGTKTALCCGPNEGAKQAAAIHLGFAAGICVLPCLNCLCTTHFHMRALRSLDIAPTNQISNKWGVLFQKSSFCKVAY